MTEDPLALVGTTVADKYDIERVVGQGGFAIVYRANHKVWNRPVAIKVFRAFGDLPAARRTELLEHFLQEGRLLAELSERSAAIVQARDVGTLRTPGGSELPYMVLEWLEGRTLEEVIEDEKERGVPPRAPAEAFALLEPAAHALALAHKKGIAHRDVKPANLFVIGDPRGDFTVKVLDFGIAKVMQDVQRMAGALGQTLGHVTSFTPAYGAPEQFSREHGATGPWTDVFALALVFAELVTHGPPLLGETVTQLGFASMNPEVRPTPRAMGAVVSDSVEAVLRRAVAVAPSDRYGSAGEMWSALREAFALAPLSGLAESQPMSASPVSAPDRRTADPTLPEPRRTSRAKSFAVVGAAVVLAGVTFVALRARTHVAAATPLAPPTLVQVVSAPAPSRCPDGMTLVPAGKFFMGSDDKSDEEHERPAHQITLSAYCMDTFEVTVEQYKACSDRGECKRAPRENDWEGISDRERKIYDPLCNIREPEARAKHPINCVDFALASAFCSASGKRLPTEAEWEYATRGSDGRKYPWGDEPPKAGGHLNACGPECVAWGKKTGEDVSAMYPVADGYPNTAPVGSFPKGASPFGLQDVVGNVWEWTGDWHAAYEPAALVDPKGPAAGSERVIRGGAWNGSDVAWVRPTYRFKLPPAMRSHGVGFRCASVLVTGP